MVDKWTVSYTIPPVYRVVFDTSLVIAGLRSANGASFELLVRVDDGSFRLCLSVPLVVEYEAVIKRQADRLNLTEQEIDRFVSYLCAVAEPVEIHYLWRPTLPDPDDDMLLEVAVAGQCDYIVTHNLRHFVGAEKFGVKVVAPGDFLMMLGG